MKYFDWDNEKNEWLMRERGISFEVILLHLEAGKLVSIEDNHHPYEHQKVLMVQIEEYIYEVPYVDDGEKIFFKTIYRSSRATKKYLP